MNINDYLTHIDNPEDVPFLKTKLFDVNLRLFKSNKHYHDIIKDCCNLISVCASNKMDGYKKPHGMSGANVGIPFNIIGIVKNRGTIDQNVLIMINPKILEYDGSIIECETNCGSIRLKNPIKINRSEKVCVEYYTFQVGDYQLNKLLYIQKWFNREEGSLTIQHEIDHNLGILITDYYFK